jgi:hypothetical protein
MISFDAVVGEVLGHVHRVRDQFVQDPQIRAGLVGGHLDRHRPATQGAAAAFAKDSRHIIAVGGAVVVTGEIRGLRSSEVYDIASNVWQTLEVELSQARSSLVCALEDRNTVLAIGGAVRQNDTETATDLVEAIRFRFDNDDDDA